MWVTLTVFNQVPKCRNSAFPDLRVLTSKQLNDQSNGHPHHRTKLAFTSILVMSGWHVDITRRMKPALKVEKQQSIEHLRFRVEAV
jgi:hypothetical protein